jgi:hypothetical protein
MTDTDNALKDTAVSGVPNAYVAVIGAALQKVSDADLAVAITIGSTGGTLKPHHKCYASCRDLFEKDGKIRPDTLECVLYWARQRPAFQRH